MHSEVQGDWDPRDAGLAIQLGITKSSSGTMVEYVEENLMEK